MTVTSANYIRVLFNMELFRWPVTLHLLWKDRCEKTDSWISVSKFSVGKFPIIN